MKFFISYFIINLVIYYNVFFLIKHLLLKVRMMGILFFNKKINFIIIYLLSPLQYAIFENKMLSSFFY